jgi:hypothetical protein
MARFTYTVRMIVDHDDSRHAILKDGDFGLVHPYGDVEIQLSIVDSVVRWKDGQKLYPNGDSVENVCDKCFGDLDHPTGVGFPVDSKDCHRAFAPGPTQGVLA